MFEKEGKKKKWKLTSSSLLSLPESLSGLQVLCELCFELVALMLWECGTLAKSDKDYAMPKHLKVIVKPGIQYYIFLSLLNTS